MEYTFCKLLKCSKLQTVPCGTLSCGIVQMLQWITESKMQICASSAFANFVVQVLEFYDNVMNS